MTAGTIATTITPRRATQSVPGGDERPGARRDLDLPTLVDAYGAHRADAYRLAYRILGDGPAAEDAVQDAFLKLWKGGAQFDPARGSMRGLLLTIARHTSIDFARRRARRQRTEGTYCADATYVTDGPERASEDADRARHVRDALLTLSGEQRSAIELAYLSGLTCRQIAGEMVIPVGTVKSRMRLGLRKLAATPSIRAMRCGLEGEARRQAISARA